MKKSDHESTKAAHSRLAWLVKVGNIAELGNGSTQETGLQAEIKAVINSRRVASSGREKKSRIPLAVSRSKNDFLRNIHSVNDPNMD